MWAEYICEEEDDDDTARCSSSVAVDVDVDVDADVDISATAPENLIHPLPITSSRYFPPPRAQGGASPQAKQRQTRVLVARWFDQGREVAGGCPVAFD